MKFIFIKNLLKKIVLLQANGGDINQNYFLSGWIYNINKRKNIIFIWFSDGISSNKLQIICKKEVTFNFNNLYKELRKFLPVNIEVTFSKPDKTNAGNLDVIVKKLDILNVIDNKFVNRLETNNYNYLRTIPHFRVKFSYFASIFRIRSFLAIKIHEYFHKNNFLYLQSPIITTNDAEGAGEVFKLVTDNFFDKEVFLTVSGQLTAESFTQNFARVYTFGPTFRLDPSDTFRHAAEFWMIEPEIAFFKLFDLIKFSEKFIKFLIKQLLKFMHHELLILKTDINFLRSILQKKFNLLTYDDAILILKKAVLKNTNLFSEKNNKIYWGMNLGVEHENYLASVFSQKVPIFIINYPKEIKPFYMKVNEDKKTVSCMDLLVPKVGELIGGSERENDFLNLKKNFDKIKDNKVKDSNLEWYLDLRRIGYAPSAGFGIGFERLIMFFTGIENIRDVIPFPRTKGVINF